MDAMIALLIGEISEILNYDIRATGVQSHTYFRRMELDYKNYYWSYKGWPHTRNNIPNYIPRYPREDSDAYSQRVSRAYPVNFSRALINKTVSAVWTEVVNRDGIAAGSDERLFEMDCNMQGRSLDSIMRFAARATYYHGFHLLLMDSLSEDDLTNGSWIYDQAAYMLKGDRLGLPYLASYNANSILDWGYDRFGNLNYVVLLDLPDEYLYGTRADSGLASNYRVITPLNIYTVRQDRVAENINFVIRKYPHILSDYGIMPIVPMVGEDDEKCPFTCASGISEIAGADQAIVNYMSLRDDVFHKQTFGQLIIQAANDDDIREIKTGTTSVLRYPPEMNPPAYIAPPPQVIEGLNSGIESAVTQIQRITDQRFSDTGQETSASSKAWDFHNQEFGIVSMAKICQKAENRLFWMFQLAMKTIKYPDESGIQVHYGDAFDLKGAREFIDDYTAAVVGFLLPQHAQRVATWTAVTKLLPNLSPEDKTIISRQLDDMEKNNELGSPSMPGGLNPFDTTGQIEGNLENNGGGIKPASKPDNRLANQDAASPDV